MKSDPLKATKFLCRSLQIDDAEGVDDRQDRIEGFDQRVLSNSSIVHVGGGGIGSEVTEGLVRKGVGSVDIFDFDRVEASNLNRQKFTHKDIGKNKAIALARNLSKEGFLGTEIVAYPLSFEDAVQSGYAPSADIIAVGVDSDEARVWISEYCLKNRIVMINAGTDRNAQVGAVFVQGVDGPCFQCLYPNVGQRREANDQRCKPAGAVKDPLKLLASLVLYAIDSVLMDRYRSWTFRQISLASAEWDTSATVTVRRDCPLCSKYRDKHGY